MPTITIIPVLLLAAVLTACGGGGSGGGGAFAPAPAPTSASFADMCAVPRTGQAAVNPLSDDGETYGDVQGTLVDEKNWIRSHMNEVYLWFNEVEDVPVNGPEDPLDYFDALRTTQLHSSGTAKDKDSWAVSTADYVARVMGVEVSYGLRYVFVGAGQDNLRVGFVEAGSPGAAAGINRGDRVLSVNGIPLDGSYTQSEVDALNQALGGPSVGDVLVLVIEPRAGGAASSKSLTARVVAEAAVPENSNWSRDKSDPSFGEMFTGSGRIGYLLFNTFGTLGAEAEVYEAITSFNQAGTQTDFILDLRLNRGGYVYLALELAYMIAGQPVLGRPLGIERTNGKIASETWPVMGESVGFDEDELAKGVPLPTLGLSKLYVLASSSTCSASELIVNGLAGLDINVVLIGTTTCGKPYASLPTDNCGNTFAPLRSEATNAKGVGGYHDGLKPSTDAPPLNKGRAVPGCWVADSFSGDMGALDDNVLLAALHHIENGDCPDPPAAAPPVTPSHSIEGAPAQEPSGGEQATLTNADLILRPAWKESAILGTPSGQ